MNVVLNNILEKELKKNVLNKDLDKNKNLGKISYWYHAFIGYHNYFCQFIKSIDFSCQEDIRDTRRILANSYEIV